MKWNEVSNEKKQELLEIYKKNRSVKTITSYARELDILPDTLTKRLRELEYQTRNIPEYSEEQFPDRKQRDVSFSHFTSHIQEIQRYEQENSIAQDEATWHPKPEYPDLPIAILWMSDVHYGSKATDYDMLLEHLDIVRNTPNMYIISGGDEIDNFSPAKYPDGIISDLAKPGDQILAWGDLLKQLTYENKLAAVVWGNHTAFSKQAGIDPYEFWHENTECPFFTDGGGTLHIVHGNQIYNAGLRHTYFGNSKVNPSNAAKKLMQYGYPDLDIACLAHTHWSSGEMFTSMGREKIAVIGGTYKLFDSFRKNWDGDPHPAGYTIVLHPESFKMLLFRFPEMAQQYISGCIASSI